MAVVVATAAAGAGAGAGADVVVAAVVVGRLAELAEGAAVASWGSGAVEVCQLAVAEAGTKVVAVTDLTAVAVYFPLAVAVQVEVAGLRYELHVHSGIVLPHVAECAGPVGLQHWAAEQAVLAVQVALAVPDVLVALVAPEPEPAA